MRSAGLNDWSEVVGINKPLFCRPVQIQALSAACAISLRQSYSDSLRLRIASKSGELAAVSTANRTCRVYYAGQERKGELSAEPAQSKAAPAAAERVQLERVELTTGGGCKGGGGEGGGR